MLLLLLLELLPCKPLLQLGVNTSHAGNIQCLFFFPSPPHPPVLRHSGSSEFTASVWFRRTKPIKLTHLHRLELTPNIY